MHGRVVVVKQIFQRKKKKAGKKIEDPNDETKVDSDEDTCAKASTQNVSYSSSIIHFIEGTPLFYWAARNIFSFNCYRLIIPA